MPSVDDWAFHRGTSYGTLLLDLETHAPVDLLPDRTAETLASWLLSHPGVQLISRDRAGEYAQGAKKGAPEAIQVADRFHLSKNLSEVVERILSHHRQALRQIRFVAASSRSDSPLAVRYLRPDRKRRKQEVLQARQARAEQIQQLLAQGMTQLAIARQLHLNRKTVALAAKTPSLTPALQPARAGILAPFTRYLAARWQTGERNGVGLYREVVSQGYTGSRMTVERFLLGLRDLEKQGQLPVVLSAPMEMTPHRAVGILLKRAEDRTPEETQALLRVGQIHPDIARTRQLMQHFQQMLRERHGEELDAWLEMAMHSGIPEWRAFARKLRQDHAAVQAGLTLKWNNGLVEGHINRLKFVKRSMYGRANFDLLRRRVLPHRKGARTGQMGSLQTLSTTIPGPCCKAQIQVLTFFQWEENRPGFVEMDLVAHCGEHLGGRFLYTLTLTDLATGWTECIPLLDKSADAVLAAPEQARALFPFPLLGIDTVSGSEFLNDPRDAQRAVITE